MTDDKRRWGHLSDKAEVNECSNYRRCSSSAFFFFAFIFERTACALPIFMRSETRRAVKGGVGREVWELGMRRPCGYLPVTEDWIAA